MSWVIVESDNCSMPVPSHHLNQWWHWSIGKYIEWNLNPNPEPFTLSHYFFYSIFLHGFMVCVCEVSEWISNFITLYNGCNYLLMLGSKLNHVSKRGSCMEVFDTELYVVAIHQGNQYWIFRVAWKNYLLILATLDVTELNWLRNYFPVDWLLLMKLYIASPD